MPHDVLWSLWFKEAANLLPADCLASATCGPDISTRMSDATEQCLSRRRGKLYEIGNMQGSRNVHALKIISPRRVIQSTQLYYLLSTDSCYKRQCRYVEYPLRLETL